MSNMESMLLGGDDDSSSGESGDEVDVPSRSTTATTTVNPVPAQPTGPKTSATVPPRAAPIPTPAPMTATASGGSNSNSGNNQMNERLKNLYSQNKRPTSQPVAPIPAPAPTAPMNSRPTMPHTTKMASRQPSQSLPPPLNPNPPLAPNQPRMSTHPQAQRTHVANPISKPTQPTQYNNHGHSSRSAPQTQHRQHQPRQQHSDTNDPFAPTPLSKIKARQQQHLDAQQRARTTNPQTQKYPSSSRQGTTNSKTYQGSAGAGGSSQVQQDRAAREQELRRQKEKFLVFTRVLIKYLEQKDPNLHRQAKAIIKDCAERNKRQEPGYTSVTASMKTRLRQLVGENYWKRAEAYLKHFLEQKAAANRSSGGSSSSQQARQNQLAAARQQQQQKRQQYAQGRSNNSTPVATNLTSVQQEIMNRKNEIERSATSKASSTLTGGKEASGKGASTGKKQSASKRKSGASTPTRKSSTGGSSSTAAAAKEVQASEKEEAPREYSELMEMIDHAVDYDWTTAGQLMKSKSDLQVDEEQRKLLYGEKKPQTPPPDVSGPRPGWDKKNVFSARAAWARVRLGEQKAAQGAPVVAGGLITLPTNNILTPTKTETAWVNEETAEQDVTLAMLSEACQEYLKGVLQKAVHCARQRQNIDGIRLWHQQHTASEDDKPSLSLRLGCDVSRQVAQVSGNAAMTCKRMEEALERQSGVSAHARVLKGSTLEDATSMSDLAMRPKLAKGVESADHQAKKDYEIFGGKHSSEPPLGRVPKRAKIETSDLVMGSSLSQAAGRHHATTASASVFY